MTSTTPETPTEQTADVLVVGSGIAGCAAAFAAAREGADVLLATKAEEPADATSDWAQGGIAVTRSEPAAFREDVLAASDGTADPEAVDVLVDEARDAVDDVLLDTLGVEFDVAEEVAPGGAGTDRDVAAADDSDLSDLDFGREAAHSERRIIHVGAETGRHVLRPFLAFLADHERVRIVEDAMALDLLTDEGRVAGAVLERDGEWWPAYAGATVLATGGIGDCFARSTNPRGTTGDGVAMAALAGADVADAAYVQFHPTALDGDAPAVTDDDGPALLLSEAVRGEGATLHDADGERFMPEYHEDAELAPRDVVARAVARERDRTGRVRLDVSAVDFAAEFPTLAEACADRGVDPAAGIPVAPAEHFLCGGVAVDDRGRATLDRLFAAGECAHTGVHGANRLASTSLLEGLVWGLRAGETAAGTDPIRVDPPEFRDSDPDLPENFAAGKFRRLRRLCETNLGPFRTEGGIARAGAALRRLKGEVDAYTRTRTGRDIYELRNAVVAALLVARDAAEAEPAGCHHLVEEDPTADDAEAGRAD
ncbi:MAG: L-aspartate oxidase [Halolamina sp.]